MTKVAAVTSKSAKQLLRFQQNNGYLNDVRLESFGFFLDDYVIYGGDLNFDTVDTYKLLLTESIISLNDELWRAFIKEFRITKYNTTFYVGFVSEQGYVFGETEPFENYLRLWTIPVDANGHIGVPIDYRNLYGYIKFKAKYDGVYLNTDEVQQAIVNANNAANNANQATSDVQLAVDDAKKAVGIANEAIVKTEAAIVKVNASIEQVGQAVTNANTATGNADQATQDAKDATQDARNTIINMQNFVNQLGTKEEYNNAEQYFTNNIVTLNGSSFIARKDTKGNPPPTFPTITNDYWQLVALQGKQGLPGQDGKDGTGINIIGELQSEDDLPAVGAPGDAYMINGDLYVWQDNLNVWENVGPIRGPEGKSAFKIAVENGFEGTMQEWIESLKGEQGPRGPEGPRGLSGQDGKDGTGVNIIGELPSENDLPSVGAPGDAYMIAGDLYVWQNNSNTWKNVGPIRGPQGKSAYDIAVENGFEGTMEEWIVSLKGEQGIPGTKGDPGEKGEPGQDADLTEVTEQLEQMKPKVDNSWQKGVYNDADIVNLGAKNATKTIIVADTDWKGTTNVEVAQIVLPLRRFSGLIKVSFASTWINFNAGGGAEVVYQIFKVTSTTHVNNMIINNISSQFAEAYRIQGAAITESGIVLSIVKSPQAKNTVVVKIELLSVFEGGDNDVFNALKNTTVEMVDIGLPPIGGYPWKPQSPTALMANTYNASNTITNVGANRATRTFPQVNWKGAQSTPELWESILIMTRPVWGILELDIAGYSAASGGAKFVIELGIHVPNDTTSPSVEFRNVMKVVTASAGFTDNFYVRVEHRPSARYLIIQVFKRIYNDPVSVVATFTSTVSPQASFDTLKGFSDGVNYTNGISIPTEIQKDFDTRIKENFTLFGDFKNKLAPAITEKGVATNADATADQMVANIRAIPTGVKKAEFDLQTSSVILDGGTGTITTPVMNFQPMNATNTMIGTSIFRGMGGDISQSTVINGIAYVEKCTINNIGNGNYTVTFTIKNRSGAGVSLPIGTSLRTTITG